MDPRKALDGLQVLVTEYAEAHGRAHFDDTRTRLLARLTELSRELDAQAARRRAAIR